MTTTSWPVQCFSWIAVDWREMAADLDQKDRRNGSPGELQIRAPLRTESPESPHLKLPCAVEGAISWSLLVARYATAGTVIGGCTRSPRPGDGRVKVEDRVLGQLDWSCRLQRSPKGLLVFWSLKKSRKMRMSIATSTDTPWISSCSPPKKTKQLRRGGEIMNLSKAETKILSSTSETGMSEATCRRRVPSPDLADRVSSRESQDHISFFSVPGFDGMGTSIIQTLGAARIGPP
jgi:hypothetical protein